MTHILLWVEPHPIRGRHDEFFDHAVFLAEALLALRERGVTFSLFSNRVVLDRLSETYPAARGALVYPTEAETDALDAYAGIWDETRIRTWLDLVSGCGPATAFHRRMAERVIAATRPAAIVIWSDNAAVRQAAAGDGLPVLSCELGPTRPPFPATFYADPAGTNGAALMRRCPPDLVRDAKGGTGDASLPPDVHAVIGRARSDLPRPDWAPAGQFALVPLQLADDLNVLLNSDFGAPGRFVAEVLPRLLAKFDHVVVKGHPGAGERPGNRRSQDQAIAHARALGPRVVIAPERLLPDEQLWLLGRAGLVCALNTSLAFEALLLGTPVTLLGDAAYDLGGTLKRPLDDMLQPADAGACRSLAEANFGMFLARKDTGDAGEVLLRALQAAAQATEPQVWLRRLADAQASVGPALCATASKSSLRGYLEDIDEVTAGSGLVRIRLRGWLFDEGRDRPVDRIGVAADDRVLASTDAKGLRPDVARRLRIRTCSLGFELDVTCPAQVWQGATIRAVDSHGGRQDFAIAAGRLIALPGVSGAAFPPIATRKDGRPIRAAVAKPARARLFLANLLQRQRPNLS